MHSFCQIMLANSLGSVCILFQKSCLPDIVELYDGIEFCLRDKEMSNIFVIHGPVLTIEKKKKI